MHQHHQRHFRIFLRRLRTGRPRQLPFGLRVRLFPDFSVQRIEVETRLPGPKSRERPRHGHLQGAFRRKPEKFLDLSLYLFIYFFGVGCLRVCLTVFLGDTGWASRAEADAEDAEEWVDADDVLGRDWRDSEQPEAAGEREPPRVRRAQCHPVASGLRVSPTAR